MHGILRIALKLLVNDRGKFAALLVGITFAVLLMVMVTSMFAGVMSRASATVINTGSSLWVMNPPVKLSGGEQQRVAIARAVVSRPDLLILDEPTASLDGDTGRRIIDFVKREVLNAHRCILIVTHDSRIFEYSDRILHMEDGRLRQVEEHHVHE